MEFLVISADLAVKFDELTGIIGSAYWQEPNGDLVTTLEHLATISAEFGIDFEATKELLSVDYYADLAAGKLADWVAFKVYLLVDEPLFALIMDAGALEFSIGYWVNQCLLIISSDAIKLHPEILQKPWTELLVAIAATVGTFLTPESILRWNTSIDTYRLPAYLKFEVTE